MDLSAMRGARKARQVQFDTAMSEMEDPIAQAIVALRMLYIEGR